MNKKATARTRHNILVIGTVANQTVLIPEKQSSVDNNPKPSFVQQRAVVGTRIVQEMIKNAVRSPKVGIYPKSPGTSALELMTVLNNFPTASYPNKDERSLRVKNTYRYSNKNNNFKDDLRKTISKHNNSSIVVVYEQDDTFRKTFRAIAKNSRATGAAHLVIALAESLAIQSIESAKRLFGEKSITVVIPVDCLRRAGCNIVAYGSIEQSVQDLALCIEQKPLKDIWELCSNLIVLFEENAIVLLPKGETEGTIHLCPNTDRTAYADKEKYGTIPGKTATVLTAVVDAIYYAISKKEKLNRKSLNKALRRAMLVYDRMFEIGFSKNDPFKDIYNILSPNFLTKINERISETSRQLPCSLDFPCNSSQANGWNRLEFALSKYPGYLPIDIFLKMVMNGPEEVFQTSSSAEWPKHQITCPYMEIGKLRTFDSEEIKQLSTLIKLMRKYHEDQTWRNPLSIAVFGPPGSGKSFAAKEIIRVVNPKIKDSSILTFNLAQFDSLEFLTEAFHQVQDKASTGDVPLVIFDEFDSVFQDSPLGWLKYFLAPMEDGIFKGRTTDYQIGRAVFLFAGGTADSFGEFTRGMSTPGALKYPAESESHVDKKAVKLPDFASRLVAHLDVLGINPTSAETSNLKIRRLARRAILLRSLLLEFAKPIVDHNKHLGIDKKVVEAFLDDNVVYKNQSRSMKVIVRSSNLIGNRLLIASLPSENSIKLQTTNWPFERLYNSVST